MTGPWHTSRRRVLQLGAAAAAAPMMITGCATPVSSGSASLRFAFWGSDDRIKRFQDACKLFTQKNPQITILPEFGAIDAIETKTTVAMAAKNLPDVTWVLGNLFPQMVADGHLVDLTEHLGQGIGSDGFSKALLAPGMINGKQYALTHGLQSVGMFAKEPVLDEVGIPIKRYPEGYSWAEYAEHCRAIHQAKGAKFFGTDDPNYAGAGNFFRAFARQHGQNLWNEDGDLGFTPELFTEWLEYWEGLRADGAVVPTELALEQNPYFEGAPMIRGLAAFHLRNSNQLLELQTLSKEPLVLMPAPGNGGDGNRSIALDPNMLGIAANTKHLDAAIKFVDFLINDPDRAKIIGTTIGGPPKAAIREAIADSVSDVEQQFLDYIGFEAEADSDPVPPGRPTSGAFNSELTKALESLAYGKATVQQTVDLVFGDLRTKLMA